MATRLAVNEILEGLLEVGEIIRGKWGPKIPLAWTPIMPKQECVQGELKFLWDVNLEVSKTLLEKGWEIVQCVDKWFEREEKGENTVRKMTVDGLHLNREE